MSLEKFEELMLKADTMMKVEPAKGGYWRGYMRGLRRAHLGQKFGTTGEHQLYLSLVNSRDDDRQELGRGYVEGLAALTP